MAAFPKYNIYNATLHYPLIYKNNSVSKDAFTNLNIQVSANESFEYKIIDFFPNKSPPKIFTQYHQIQDYISNSTFANWENQFKSAIFCTTSGCGVSWNNHLNNYNLLVRSIFRFHVYFQIRKILHFLQIPLPGNPDFNSANNPYNKLNYEQLKLEFTPVDWTNFVLLNSNGLTASGVQRMNRLGLMSIAF